MGLRVVAIDHLLVCRYAESAPDGTANILGAGVRHLQLRPDGTPTRFSVAAGVTVVAADTRAMLACRLFAPSGTVSSDFEIGVDGIVGDDVGQVPLCFDLALTLRETGTWRVELSCDGDMRAVTFTVA
jgi:hypothetical protein